MRKSLSSCHLWSLHSNDPVDNDRMRSMTCRPVLSSNPLLWLTDESFRVNCELEPSHEICCTMGTHTQDADMLTLSDTYKRLYSSFWTTSCSFSTQAVFSTKACYCRITNQCNLILHFHDYFSNLLQYIQKVDFFWKKKFYCSIKIDWK